MEGEMRSKDRLLVVVLSLTLAAGLACGCRAMSLAQAPRRAAAMGGIADPPRRPGRPLLSVAMPDSAHFQATRTRLFSRLTSTFDSGTMLVEPRPTSTGAGTGREAASPTCLVLVSNSTVRL